MSAEPGTIESMLNTIARNNEIIDSATEWTPELQMRIDQTYILGILVECLDK